MVVLISIFRCGCVRRGLTVPVWRLCRYHHSFMEREVR